VLRVLAFLCGTPIEFSHAMSSGMSIVFSYPARRTISKAPSWFACQGRDACFRAARRWPAPRPRSQEVIFIDENNIAEQRERG
jgi:hypothetical protein